MDKLRVDSGIKKIEVNDSGEYIEIPINDAAFYQRFFDIMKQFEKRQDDIDKQIDELSKKYKNKPDNDPDMISDSFDLYAHSCKEVCADLDSLFGNGCCKKVFPGIETPGIELIDEFFSQISPLLQRYIEERGEKISLKYNRGRKGARS